jgi:hypothetical protein
MPGERHETAGGEIFGDKRAVAKSHTFPLIAATIDLVSKRVAGLRVRGWGVPSWSTSVPCRGHADPME